MQNSSEMINYIPSREKGEQEEEEKEKKLNDPNIWHFEMCQNLESISVYMNRISCSSDVTVKGWNTSKNS